MLLDQISIFPSFTNHQILKALSNTEVNDPELSNMMNDLLNVEFSNHLKQEVINTFNIDEANFALLAFEYFKLLLILKNNSHLLVPENLI